MDEGLNEVRFDLYCESCKHWSKKDQEEPCSECLAVPANLYSQKPVRWEEKN
jgi:hypothetical protein